MKTWSPTWTSDMTSVLLQWKPGPEVELSSNVDPRLFPFKVISRLAHGVPEPSTMQTEKWKA